MHFIIFELASVDSTVLESHFSFVSHVIEPLPFEDGTIAPQHSAFPFTFACSEVPFILGFFKLHTSGASDG